MMTIIRIVIFLFLFSDFAYAERCAVFPLKGDGSDANSYDANIPEAVFNANPDGVVWGNIIPDNPDGTLKFSDVLTCFPDSIRLPGIQVLQNHVAEILAREPMANLSRIKELPPPRGRISQARDRALRSWAWLPKLFETAIAWAASATDNFNRADNADLGANWDAGYTGWDACSILSNHVELTSGNVSCFETYNALLPGAAQYSQIQIITSFNTTVGDFIGAAIRAAASSTDQMYLCRAQVGDGGTAVTSRIQRRNSGTNANLATETSTVWAATDVVRCEGNGTGLTFKRNGGTLLTATDGTFTTGRTGFGMLGVGASDVQVDNFEVGDLTSGVITRQRVMIVQ